MSFLALVQMGSMCADYERSEESRTPTCSSGMPFKTNWGWTEFLLCEIVMVLQLIGLRVSLLQLTQSLIRSMSNCRWLKSSVDFMVHGFV